MIEKDEAHVIEETLESIYKYIDYYVISDTGSTDNTKEVITNFFEKKGIKGKIYDDPWQNHFGINRTLALRRCEEEEVKEDINIDYIWVIDADDIIVGDLVLPDKMDADCYSLIYGDGFTYHRSQIFKNDPKIGWRYDCVRHEYPTCDKKNFSTVHIEGNYYIDSRRKGARSQVEDKYLGDALAFEEWILKEPEHKTRYMFYMAQSYFDHATMTNSPKYMINAIDRYKQRIDMGGWYEETFYSYYKVAEGLQWLKKPWEEVEQAYLDAYNFCKIRSEPLYKIANYYANQKDPRDFNTAYKYLKKFATIPYPKQCKLFIFKSIYFYEGPDLLARMAFYNKKYAESYYIYKNLLEQPDNVVPPWFKENIKKDIQFSQNQLINNVNCCMLFTGNKLVPYNSKLKELFSLITQFHTLYIIGNNVDYRYTELDRIIYAQKDIIHNDRIEFKKVFVLDDMTFYSLGYDDKFKSSHIIHINTTDHFRIHPSTKYTVDISNKKLLDSYLKHVHNIMFFGYDEFKYDDFVNRYRIHDVADITDNINNIFNSEPVKFNINPVLADNSSAKYNGFSLRLPNYIKNILANDTLSDNNKNIIKKYFNAYKSAVKNTPDSYHYMADYYEKIGNHQQALNMIDDAIKLTKNNPIYSGYLPTLFVEKGKYLHMLGKYQQSYNICHKAICLPDLHPSGYQYAENWRDRNIDHIKDNTLKYPSKIIANIMQSQKGHIGPDKKYPIVFSVTTCKRYDLFHKTINSFLNCCNDYDKIDRWILVDDNSSKSDRKLMMEKYPFFKFIFKNEQEKGHYKSMNIIHDYITKHNTKYLIHTEDDFHYVEKRDYITDAIDIFEDNIGDSTDGNKEQLGQVLFNRNYAEVEMWKRMIPGGFRRKVRNTGLRYVIHEHYDTDTWEYHNFSKTNGGGMNSYWPYFSFRPSVLKCDMLREIGIFLNTPHFELQYAKEYKNHGYKSAFFDSFCCIHNGKKTFEADVANAYTLNKTMQFFANNNNIRTKVIKHDNNDIWNSFKMSSDKYLPCIEILQNHYKEIPEELKHMFLNNNFQYRRDLLNNIINQIYATINCDYEICILINDNVILNDNIINAITDIINNKDINADVITFNNAYDIYIVTRNGSEKIKSNLPNIYGVNNISDVFAQSLLNMQNIQLDIETKEITFSNPVDIDGYRFYSNMDSHGNDITYIGGGKSVSELKEIADSMKDCIAFNTLGWFKHSVLKEDELKYLYLSDKVADGLYIKK